MLYPISTSWMISGNLPGIKRTSGHFSEGKHEGEKKSVYA